MFETYKATKNDFQAIEEGIKTVWLPVMNFVFKNKKLISNVVVISYDSKFLYLWTKFKVPGVEIFPCQIKNYHAYKIPHQIRLQDEWQLGWKAGLSIAAFIKLFPKKLKNSNFKITKISGGLLTPFIELQKKKKGIKFNPYTTHESYLATIVHEFGHVYYHQHKLWWYSNKKGNLTYIRTAIKLFEDKRNDLNKIKIKIPYPPVWSEVFAFCTDYCAASFFWPKHEKDIDRMNLAILKRIIPREKEKDLGQEDSLFDGEQSSHMMAAIFGKIILTRYPHKWPQKLLQPLTI